MSLIRKHGAVLQAWACLDLVAFSGAPVRPNTQNMPKSASVAENTNTYNLMHFKLLINIRLCSGSSASNIKENVHHRPLWPLWVAVKINRRKKKPAPVGFQHRSLLCLLHRF